MEKMERKKERWSVLPRDLVVHRFSGTQRTHHPTLPKKQIQNAVHPPLFPGLKCDITGIRPRKRPIQSVPGRRPQAGTARPGVPYDFHQFFDLLPLGILLPGARLLRLAPALALLLAEQGGRRGRGRRFGAVRVGASPDPEAPAYPAQQETEVLQRAHGAVDIGMQPQHHFHGFEGLEVAGWLVGSNGPLRKAALRPVMCLASIWVNTLDQN